MKLKIATIVSALFLIASPALPTISAAVDHQLGQINLRWSTSNLYLNQNSYIEQEFIPTENAAFVDGAQFRWTNAFHLDFCWQGQSGLTSTGDKCGFVGVGIGSKNGSNYYGNIDFALFNGIDFSILKNESNVFCDKRVEAGYIGNIQSYYIPCWKSVVLQMGTPYVVRVQWDPSNTANDNNWWSATLTNKKTNESVLIGKIKSSANAYMDQLTSLQTVVFYNGEAKACDAVPIFDLRVAPPRTQSNSGNYLNQWLASCVRAYSGPSNEFKDYYSIRLGGANPETREPGYVKPAEPSSSPKPSPSATPTQPKQIAKPSSPIFSGIKISGNTLNINVNLNGSKPDKVYLIAPKLSANLDQKIFAEIKDDSAIWNIKFDPESIKGVIPISFVSLKDGESSNETKIEYLLPNMASKNVGPTKLPQSPTNVTSRIVGIELLVSAKIITSGSNAAENVSLYSNVLGISRSKPLKGNLLTNNVIFSIPVSPDVLSKKIDLNLFAGNRIGESRVVVSSFSIPVPKSPTYKTNNQNVTTVICSKGSTLRTFVSKSCPPGWKIK